jgi:hypothetical protein
MTALKADPAATSLDLTATFCDLEKFTKQNPGYLLAHIAEFP